MHITSNRHRSIATTTISPRRQLPVLKLTDTQLASACASITSRLILHPIDCIKTRMQLIRARPDTQNGFQTLVRFIASEGLPGLYRGILGALIGVLPYSMIYMPSYEFAQSTLSSRLGNKQLLGARNLLAGSVAGFCGSLVKVPVDVVKKRLQAGIYPNIKIAIKSILKDGNGKVISSFRQFYTGWRSSLFYDIPYNAVQFTVLENVKQFVKKLKKKETLGKMENALVGAMTGMITSIITEPFDVIKTRLMTQNVNAQNTGLTVYRGWLHCFTTIIKEEGIISLWKGTLPRLIWVGTSSAIWYGTYQTARQAIANRNKKLLKSE